jgi:hypothetical protein
VVLSGRSDDPKLELLARQVFAMFPQCHRCGQTIERFEDADVRVHVQRVVHRASCPSPPIVERVVPPAAEPEP